MLKSLGRGVDRTAALFYKSHCSKSNTQDTILKYVSRHDSKNLDVAMQGERERDEPHPSKAYESALLYLSLAESPPPPVPLGAWPVIA